MAHNQNENRGCLGALLSLFGRRGPKVVAPAAQQPAIAPKENLPYRLRDDFLSRAELSFYHVLRGVVGERATVQAKVGLAEIFFVARPQENQSARARIVQKHADFLLCDPSTMRPLVGIELDDASHSRADRQERDNFVAEVFKAAGLPLLRIPAQHAYNAAAISEQLAPHLASDGSGSVAGTQDAPQTDNRSSPAVPQCPKCGIPMVVRTATRGERRGERFFGCSNYPRCTATLPLDAPQ